MENDRQLVTMFHTINLLEGWMARALAAPQSLGKLVSGSSPRIYFSLVSYGIQEFAFGVSSQVMLRSPMNLS